MKPSALPNNRLRIRFFPTKQLYRSPNIVRVFRKGKNGEWRRFHKKELHSLNRSPNMVRMVKCKRLGWADHVARMEEDSDFKILTGPPTRKRPLRRPRPRRTILEWILNKWL